jgi:hypothetical protein
MHRNGWVVGVVTLTAVMLITPLAYADKKPVKPTREWKGSVGDEALWKEAPPYITTAEALEKLWNAWKIGDKRPDVDFSKEIVVLSTTRGSKARLFASLDEKGNLVVGGMATRDFVPGFRYVIATVSRAGVKTVNGKELAQ